MAFRLNRPEPLDRELRRIVRERLENAAGALAQRDGHLHEGVHEARKRFKEIRAVIRLARDSLGVRAKMENAWYRDAGRSLSGLRDAQALIEACDALAKRSEPASDDLLRVVRKWLQGRLSNREQSMHDIEQQTGTLREALLGARRRVNDWHLQAFDRDALSRGYAGLYRRGQRAYRDTVEAPGDVAFHEWRKRVKDHWYHTRLLAPAWTAPLEARQTELKTLSDLLGDEHDLSVLRDTLLADGGDLLGRGEAQALLARIGRRQGELRTQAQALGARIYAEPADGLRQRILGYLDAWASEQPTPRRAGT